VSFQQFGRLLHKILPDLRREEEGEEGKREKEGNLFGMLLEMS
jgi:hypothetical protein